MKSILGPTKRHQIVFYRSGRIDISALVVRTLQLAAGDVVDCVVDDDENIYLYKKYSGSEVVGRHEATTYRDSFNSSCLRCNSVRLTQHILDLCSASACAKLAIGTTADIPPYGKCLNIIISR